ncbi:DUF2867 domain-containing protein, partial [Mesorhizobium sp. M7A.F.Ca.CA.004.06.2.1]
MENAKNKDNPAVPAPEWRRFAMQRAKLVPIMIFSEDFAVTNPLAEFVPNHCT